MSNISSMVTSIAQRVNMLTEKVNRLEKLNSTTISVRSIPDSAVPRLVSDVLEKRVATLESAISSKEKPTSYEAIVKTLTDEVKLLKASLSDMNKERVLLETALTHKFELHVNRLFKERVDAALKEHCKEQHQYVDQSVQDVKSSLNNALSIFAAHQQALPAASNDHFTIHETDLSFQTEPIDIEVLKHSLSTSDDFEIEIQTATSKLGSGGGSKRIMRKK
jgi:hypothetical protein